MEKKTKQTKSKENNHLRRTECLLYECHINIAFPTWFKNVQFFLIEKNVGYVDIKSY